MNRGSYFDIKRFALHDGPGIRTTVFLKGCPLSCKGCHNPEGQTLGPELLFWPDRCTLCGDCVSVCPNQAISISEEGVVIQRDQCDLAGACVAVCAPGALKITGRPGTVDELMEIIEADRIYFDESGGGVTFSGGEPFAQPDFLRELLKRCKEVDLDVVLDTCGHVAPETFQELAPFAARLLFDLKLVDEIRHMEFTGVHNRWILENLEWVARRNADGQGPGLTVRIPLIPGVNEDEENLRETARFLRRQAKPPPVDILPYHRLGVDKYQRMGREYQLAEVEPPDNGAVALAVRILEDEGLNVSVRGEHHGDD